VAAVEIRFGEGPALGDTLARSVVEEDGSWALVLPARPPALQELERGGDVGALVVLVAYDGEGEFVQGTQPLRGMASDAFFLWLEEENLDEQWPQGWSRADLGMAGRYAGGTRCLNDIDLPLHWRQAEGYPVLGGTSEPVSIALPGLEAPLAVAGQLTGAPDEATHIGGFWLQTVYGGTDLPPAFGVPMGAYGVFEADLQNSPPADAYVNSDPDWSYAVAYVLPYTDTNEDGAWDLGETLYDHSVCDDNGDVVALRYNRTVSTWRGYRFLQCYDARVGWTAAVPAEDETLTDWLSDEDAQALSGRSGECSLSGG
jgi:hypothetical protein